MSDDIDDFPGRASSLWVG